MVKECNYHVNQSVISVRVLIRSRFIMNKYPRSRVERFEEVYYKISSARTDTTNEPVSSLDLPYVGPVSIPCLVLRLNPGTSLKIRIKKEDSGGPRTLTVRRSRSTGRTAVTAGNANRDRGFGIGPRAAVTLNFPGAQLANESVSGAYVYSTPGPDGLRLFDASIRDVGVRCYVR